MARRRAATSRTHAAPHLLGAAEYRQVPLTNPRNPALAVAHHKGFGAVDTRANRYRVGDDGQYVLHLPGAGITFL